MSFICSKKNQSKRFELIENTLTLQPNGLLCCL